MPPRPRPIGPVLPRAIARARAAERRAFDVEARAQRMAAAAFNHQPHVGRAGGALMRDARLVRDVHTQVAADARETVTQRRLRDLLRLIEAHTDSPVATRFPLSEVHWDPVLGTTLISAKDGAEVRLGHAMETDLGRAFQMVGRLLDNVQGRKEWLKYALLDDELRPDRAVVQVVPLGQRAEEPAKAGGAAGERLPKAGPAADKAKPDGKKTDPAAAAAPRAAAEDKPQID